jgi:hypothetical protein
MSSEHHTQLFKGACEKIREANDSRPEDVGGMDYKKWVLKYGADAVSRRRIAFRSSLAIFADDFCALCRQYEEEGG